MFQKSVEKLISSTLASYHNLLSLDGKTYASKFSGRAVSLEIETPVNIKGKIEPIMKAYLSYEFKANIDIDTKVEVDSQTRDFNPKEIEESYSQFKESMDKLENKIKDGIEDVIDENFIEALHIMDTLFWMRTSITSKNKAELTKSIDKLCEIAKWDNIVNLNKLYETFSVIKMTAKHYAPVIEDFKNIYHSMRSAERPVIRFCRERGLFIPTGVYTKGIDSAVLSNAIIGQVLKT